MKNIEKMLKKNWKLNPKKTESELENIPNVYSTYFSFFNKLGFFDLFRFVSIPSNFFDSAWGIIVSYRKIS